MAENAGGAAYTDVVPEYAALGQDELRKTTARAVLAAASGRDRTLMSTRGSRATCLWCRAQANSSLSSSGSIAMGAGR